MDPVHVEKHIEKPQIPNTPNKWSFLTHPNNFFKFHLVLKNVGSVARDHMANERTFLSWIRTGLTFLTFGIGFVQFYRLDSKTDADEKTTTIESLSKPVGTLCVILSIMTMLFGTMRYLQVQELLLKDYYPATRMTIIVLILMNLSMLIILFVLDIKISVL
ncbi:hypothetical protein SBY92_002363 [Candida maltosa Xu316]